MKITFIRPSMMPSRLGDSLEPLVFAILSALTPPDFERKLYDQRIEAIPFDEPTDLVALTADTFTAKSAYQIAARYRQRGIPVVAGGIHPSLCTREALGYVDSVVIGDAEGVWPEVVQNARRGKLKPTYEGRPIPLDGLRFDRSIFRNKHYLPAMLVQFGRGCRFACDFCSVHAFYGNNLRQRPIAEVVREIESARRKYVIFTDDNLLIDDRAAEELCRSLQPLGVRWACQASLDLAGKPDLVRLMARSGCLAVVVGFESLIADNLKQMGKHWGIKNRNYIEAVRVFQEQGIMVYGSFIFGYDYDTADSFKLSVDFALKAKLFTANVSILAPFPGTPLYTRLKREGRLINDPWWLHTDYRFGQACFLPKNMTPEQLAEGCYWARSEFNKNISIMRRALGFRANLGSPAKAGIFLLVNLLTRREIQKKRGQPLGDGSELVSLHQ